MNQRIYTSVQSAFAWTFNEKEDLADIKNYFKLDDEFECIKDVIQSVPNSDLEDYLLKNSYLVKENDNFVFYEEIDYTDDDLLFYLSNKLGVNEGEH
ncbi:hypothetical protein ACSGFZ_03650 [Staphylococcus haemolyticus]|uniref:hypothetical protein n=1 Tax=Staphylococcus haemolyticus TaxID=1283 RepID=UPI003F49D658